MDGREYPLFHKMIAWSWKLFSRNYFDETAASGVSR
jgi:hypothetical protein